MTVAHLPPPFRLVVKRNGVQHSQGTAWFVTRSKVITAWHVIENMPPDAIYELEIEGGSIRLAHVSGSEDRRADVAVLQVAEIDRPRVKTGMVLNLANHMPGQNARWSARGFPARREGREQTADGEVANPCTNDGRMQLFLRQGTDETWEGISGAALIVEGRVAGLLTVQSGSKDSTAYAVPYTRVEQVVPSLRGREYRLKYREWFLSEFRPPDWCQSYAPKVSRGEREMDSDQLGRMIASRGEQARIWLVVGDDADGRGAVLRRVASAFIDSDDIENEDCLNLPIWSIASALPSGAECLLETTLSRLKADSLVHPADVEPLSENLTEAMKKGRALFVVDAAEAADIDRLWRLVKGTCSIIAGVSVSVAEQVSGAERCRIISLSDPDRSSLAAHWLAEGQVRKSAIADQTPLSTGTRPLDVLIWCRAERIFVRLTQVKGEQLDAQTSSGVDRLKELVDCLLGGEFLAEELRSGGVQPSTEAERLRDFLAELAYLTLLDGVAEITPLYVAEKMRDDALEVPVGVTAQSYLAQISEQCGLLQRAAGDAFRYAHAAVQEYLAALAMCGSTLRQDHMAEHAEAIREDEQRISKWSRALALRLDIQPGDAKRVLGTLLNHGLPKGYGTQLRNKSGPLSACVCEAVLHTERLAGKELREALGWVESPDDWTGYRPDEWRSIEELLRYLDGLAQRVPADESLALLLERTLRDAKVIDIALIRYSLAKELERRRLTEAPCRKLEDLYERQRFFEVAGHRVDGCAKVKLRFRTVRDGWFFMGAPEAEERSWPNERPRHRVWLSQYSMTHTEVTNEQYEIFDPAHEAFRRSRHPRRGEDDVASRAHHPVARVSWYEAWCFAEWMGLTLPTEAQWEKAARGDNFRARPEYISQEPMPYWFSARRADLSDVDLSDMAWFKENSLGRGTREVGDDQSDPTKISHPFELGGLCGNVWEWCMDEQGGKYSDDDRVDPKAFEVESNEDVITNRTIRGGSCDSPAWNCRHAVRHFTFPTVRGDTIGFRLCRK